jgi:hypothetical protein
MTEQISHLSIREIIRPAESGMTIPYVCTLSDGRSYFVKGRQALATGLINEVVAATLGRAFGLPIPEFCLAKAPAELLALDPGAQSSLGTGWCFASRTISAMGEMPLATLKALPREFQQRLFLFDYWIMNEDRTGVDGQGNPNLFYDFGKSAPVVIDHNMAFDPDFNFTANSPLHVCASGWRQPTVDLIFPDSIRGVMATALESMQSVEANLPTAWTEQAPAHIYNIFARLWAYEQQEFWEPLL